MNHYLQLRFASPYFPLLLPATTFSWTVESPIYGQYKINGSLLLYTPAYAQQHSKEFASLKSSVCEGVKYVYILGGDVTQEDIKSCDIFVSRRKVLDSSSSGWPVELTLQMVMDRYLLDLHNGSRTELVDYLSAIYMQLQPIVGGNEAFTSGPGFSMCFLEVTTSGSLTYTDDKKSDRTTSQSGQTSQTDLYRVDEITQNLTVHSQNSQEFGTASSAASKNELKEYITSCMLSVTTEKDAVEVNSRDQFAELCLELVFGALTRKMIPNGQQNVVYHLASIYLELRPEVEDTEAFSEEVQFFECFLKTTTPNHFGYLPKLLSEQNTIHFGLQSKADSDNEQKATEDLYLDSEASQEVGTIVSSTSEKASDLICRLERSLVVAFDCLRLLSTINSGCVWCIVIHQAGSSLAVTGQLRIIPSVEDSERYEAQLSVVRRKYTSSSMPNFETLNLFSKTSAYSGSAEEANVDHTPTNSTLTFVTHTKPNNANADKSTVPYSLISMEISEETISPGDFCMRIQGTYLLNGETVMYHETYHESISEDFQNLQQSVCNHVKFIYIYGGNVPEEYIVTCTLMVTAGTDEHAEAKLPKIYAELSLDLVFAAGLRNIFRSVQPNPVRHLASIYFELQPTLGDNEAFSDGVRFSECEDWQPSNTESHQLSTEEHATTTGTTITTTTTTPTTTTNTHFKPIPTGTLQTTRNTNLTKQTSEDGEKQRSTDHTQKTDSYPNNRTSSERVVSIRNLSNEIVGPTTEFDNSVQTTTSQTVGGSAGRSDVVPSSEDGRPSSSWGVSAPATPNKLGYSTTTVGLGAQTSLLQTASETVLGNSVLTGQSDTPKTVVSSNTTVSISTRNTEALGKSGSVLHTHNATRTGTRRRTQTTVGVSALSDGKTDVRQQETRSPNIISTVKTSSHKTSVVQQTLHSTLTTTATIFKAKQSTTPVISTVFSSEAHTSAQNAVRETTVPVILPVGEEKQALSTTFTAKVSTTSRKPVILVQSLSVVAIVVISCSGFVVIIVVWIIVLIFTNVRI
ncbi:hypothetical protein CSKR_108667 [Clonorchis sinensis]|uniref:Uncharacterized protein n=1 Tax=Clonorchis sinensis TaxID=79923 RepID=A0A8T1MMV5_CLOSI|nr:hypothetical protein CSKR_108667 [Clonorchis sinensis]